MGAVILSIDLIEVRSVDCATSPLLVPVLFDRDSAQATRSSNGVSAIDELWRVCKAHCSEPRGHVIASVIRSILTHAFMAQAGHRYARTPLGINLGDLINKIE